MARGFAYLVAIMDVRSRKILSWRLSNSMDVDFCIEALKEALDKYGKPRFFNTDQGAQFTTPKFFKILTDADVKVSMNGRGAWRDNVFVERFWWSLKFEEVYLRAYESLWEARHSIGVYMNTYNSTRRHSKLDDMTPDSVYQNLLPAVPATLPLPVAEQPGAQTVTA